MEEVIYLGDVQKSAVLIKCFIVSPPQIAHANAQENFNQMFLNTLRNVMCEIKKKKIGTHTNKSKNIH